MQKSPNQKAKIEPQIHLYKGYHWNFLRLPLGYFLKDFFYVDFFFFFFFSLYGICYNTASVLCFGFLVTRHIGS